MKSPDEIKKGLNDRIPVHYHRSDIEPRLTPLALHDLQFLHSDAIALVQMLEAQNAELRKRLDDLKEVARGNCEWCKHYDFGQESDICKKCVHFSWENDPDDNWELEEMTATTTT